MAFTDTSKFFQIKKALPVVLLAAGLTLLTACSSTPKQPLSVAPVKVATQVADILEKKVGTKPIVTCLDALPAVAGSTIRCSLHAKADVNTVYEATVRAKKVVGSKVFISVVVDNAPVGG